MKNFYFFGLLLLSIVSYAQNFSQYKRTWATYIGVYPSEPVYERLKGDHLQIFGNIESINSSDLEELNNRVLPTNSSNQISAIKKYITYAELNLDGEMVQYGYLNLVHFSRNINHPNPNYFIGKVDANSPYFVGELHDDYTYTVIETQLGLNYFSPFFDTNNIGNNYLIDQDFNTYVFEDSSESKPFIPQYVGFNATYNSALDSNGLVLKLNQQGEVIWNVYTHYYVTYSLQIINNEVVALGSSANRYDVNNPFDALLSPTSAQSSPSNIIYLRLNPTNGSYIYGTYFGDNNIFENKFFIKQHNNSLYALGSLRGGFQNPNIISSDAYQPTIQNRSSAYLGKFDFDLHPIWGTYLTSDAFTIAYAPSLSFLDDKIYINGMTLASTGLINTDYMEQPNKDDEFDAFLMKFNSNGQLIYGSYFGGNKIDVESFIYPVSEDTFYLFGNTRSDSRITTPNAYQPNVTLQMSNGNEFFYAALFSPINYLNTTDLANYTIKIYPNPTKNKQLTIDGYLAKNSVIEIYNVIGQKVYEQKAHLINRHFLHFPSLTTGTYFIKVTNINNEAITQKIIVR